MAAPVLRGISNPDYRDTLSALADEGWQISRTGGGHIKLQHEDATMPIFASSTPSDFRACRKVAANCAAALRRPPLSSHPPDPAGMNRPDYAEILKKNKNMRKNKPSRSPVFGKSPESTFPPAFAPAPFVQRDIASSSSALLAGAIAPAVASPVLPAGNRTNAKTEKAKHMPANKPASKAAPAAVEAPTPAATPEVVVAPLSPVPAPVPSSSVARPVLPEGVEAIPPAVLKLAMKIASGQLKPLLITQDMVGSTLLFEGRILFTGGTVPSGAALADAPRPVKAGACSTPPADAATDLILATLAQLAPDFVTANDVADLVWQDMGYKSQVSARASIPRRLATLVSHGKVEKRLDPVGYRLA